MRPGNLRSYFLIESDVGAIVKYGEIGTWRSRTSQKCGLVALDSPTWLGARHESETPARWCLILGSDHAK